MSRVLDRRQKEKKGGIKSRTGGILAGGEQDQQGWRRLRGSLGPRMFEKHNVPASEEGHGVSAIYGFRRKE